MSDKAIGFKLWDRVTIAGGNHYYEGGSPDVEGVIVGHATVYDARTNEAKTLVMVRLQEPIVSRGGAAISIVPVHPDNLTLAE